MSNCLQQMAQNRFCAQSYTSQFLLDGDDDFLNDLPTGQQEHEINSFYMSTIQCKKARWNSKRQVFSA